MPDARKPYVKPLVVQLHYMADQHVSQIGSCKTTGSINGPTPVGCERMDNGLPTTCAQPTS